MAVGEHTPVHEPFTHAWFEQVVPFCHVPLESQVWGVWLLHCVAPGLHVPEHAPPLQTFAQAVPSTHWPFDPHVCGTRLLHCLAPGAHTPEHAPEMHV